jgi:hypothetical protein
MSLEKCKECGGQVSSKAKACPNCGAKSPKKTSRLTKLIMILIALVSFVLIMSPTPQKEIDEFEAMMIILKDKPCAKERDDYENYRLANIEPLNQEFNLYSEGMDFRSDEWKAANKKSIDKIEQIYSASVEYQARAKCELKYLESKGYKVIQ